MADPVGGEGGLLSRRYKRGWVREGALAPPAQLGGMGERCELPHWGLGLRLRSFSSFALLRFRKDKNFPPRNMNSGRMQTAHAPTHFNLN